MTQAKRSWQEDSFCDRQLADRGHRINMFKQRCRGKIGAGFYGSWSKFFACGNADDLICEYGGNAFFTGVAFFRTNVTGIKFLFRLAKGGRVWTVTATIVRFGRFFKPRLFHRGDIPLHVSPGNYQGMA